MNVTKNDNETIERVCFAFMFTAEAKRATGLTSDIAVAIVARILTVVT
jgi:hypothetical protein